MTTRILHSDCSRCSALCCTAPSFEASAEFAFDKPAHARCPNMRDDFRCSVHRRLSASGFRGCALYECYGAGQRVTQEVYAGKTWLSHPRIADQMFAVFLVMRVLHEMMATLSTARRLHSEEPLASKIDRLFADLDQAGAAPPEAIQATDLAPFELRYRALLRELRAGSHGDGPVAPIQK